MSTPRPDPQDLPELKAIVSEQRPLFLRAASYTFVSGVLMLAPSWFMFEVYGRVIDSRTERTLWMLLLAVIGVYVVVEMLDLVRGGILRQAADAIDARVRNRLFDLMFLANLQRPSPGNVQILADLKTVREFVPSPAVVSAMDIPAAVLCLVLLFAIGPWLGVMALVGAGVQLMIALSTERSTLPMLGEAHKSSMQAQGYASGAMRNAQVIESMGMLGDVFKRWSDRQRGYIANQAKASDVAGVNAVGAKLVQTMQSSLLLGGACWLALHNDLWGGAAMLIVASILGGRALQPLAQLVGHWRTVVTAREAFGRIEKLLNSAKPPVPGMSLPAPRGLLTVEQVIAGPPGVVGAPPILRGATFVAQPGEVLAVIGPSASGKTTLARLLVGVWPAGSGKVRLDGVDVYAWHKSELGPHLGYLPQSVELFDGTVAENIARFGVVDIDRVRKAAQDVGILETLDALPAGLETRIGEEGAVLSGGQRQRVALARAIYGDPQLIVLDEPNASLDEAGEKALLNLLIQLKARGATVVVNSHRTTLLPAVDKLVVMNDGQVVMFGPRDEVLAALKKANEQARARAQQPQTNAPVAAPQGKPA